MEPSNRWITTRDALASLECSKKQLATLIFKGEVKQRIAGTVAEYLLESLPAAAQERYWQMYTPKSSGCADAEVYARAPEHSRKKADKYLQLLTSAGDLSGAALKTFVNTWNADHPDNTTSYSRLITARKTYREQGISSLLGKYGKRSCATIVPDNQFAYFKSLYLSDGRPSIVSCWKITLGWAIDNGINPALIPSHAAFARRLKNEIPEQAVYTAREGASQANRKYGIFIQRNYDTVISGECWVSDHAQVDVACTYIDHSKTRVCYPWITAWRDFKSGLWTGWYLHTENPNSDHIFQAFHRGAIKYGIPSHMILDNGKDYRCKDFAGGRKSYKVNVDEGKMTSLTSALGIHTHYAWPYNAQSKPIERDFLRLKEWFSKHNAAYRGGNVVERPEEHENTIASGRVLTFEQLEKLIYIFIEQIMMQSIVSTGYRAGKAPVDIWASEYPDAIAAGKVRHISKNALMLFCTRVSGVLTIGRRGIRDTHLGVDYYGSWMEGQRGRKVYLRRDPKAMQEAWVFDAATDTYLDNAELLRDVPALALDDVSKAQLQEAIAIKHNSNKLIKLLSRPDFEIPHNEKIQALATATRAIREMSGLVPVNQPDQSSPTLLLTDMDKVFTQHDKNKREGTMDLSILDRQMDEFVAKKREIVVFESDLANGTDK